MFFTKEEIFLSSDEENMSDITKSPPVPTRMVPNAKYCSYSSRRTGFVNNSSSTSTSRSVVKKEPSGAKSPDLVTPDKPTTKKHRITLI